MKSSTKRKVICTLCILGAVIIAGLGYWKRIGIRNTVLRMAGVDMSKSYGYYEKELSVHTKDLENLKISENDEAVSLIDTDIPSELSMVGNTRFIEEEIQAEETSGNYSFEEPLILNNPYQISPLSGLILFDTKEPCSVRVTVRGKEEAQDISGVLETDTTHRVPVVGLYPDYENTVVLELLDAQGKVLQSREIKIQTSGIPETMQDSVRVEEKNGESAYGLTMVFGQKTKYPYAFDSAGDIRWYLEERTGDSGLFALSNGRLIMQEKGVYTPSQRKPQATNLYEIDYLGRAYALYYVAGGTHHEIIEKEPGGNLLVLSSSLEGHIEDLIVELDRETGEVVNSLNLEDIFGKTHVDKVDWAHLNTVSYLPEDDSILISPRNLHSAMKINWTSHELQWILSDPEFWKDTDFEEYVLKPEGDFNWHYQQHSVYEFQSDADDNPDTMQVMLFDNHVDSSRKVDSYDGLENSYLTVYSIDEKDKTVNQEKTFDVVRSKITSNVAYDEDSNHIFGMCGWVEGDKEKRNGRIYEFDYGTGEVIREYSLKNFYYRAIEMKINFEDLAAPADIGESYIKGELRTAVETDKKAKDPEQVLKEGIQLTFRGNVLYAEAKDHHLSQVIFRGENHTYVYDTTDIKLKKKLFLKIKGELPIPVSNMEPDTYQVFCVYMDTYYDTGYKFTK